MNIRPEAIKLLKEAIGSKLTSDLAIFVEPVSSGKGNKSKNKQIKLQQLESFFFLHREENHQPNEKATS